jgi:hypothetical protein
MIECRDFRQKEGALLSVMIVLALYASEVEGRGMNWNGGMREGDNSKMMDYVKEGLRVDTKDESPGVEKNTRG